MSIYDTEHNPLDSAQVSTRIVARVDGPLALRVSYGADRVQLAAATV